MPVGDYSYLLAALGDLEEKGLIRVSRRKNSYAVETPSSRMLIVFDLRDVVSYTVEYDSDGKAKKVVLVLSNGILADIPEYG